MQLVKRVYKWIWLVLSRYTYLESSFKLSNLHMVNNKKYFNSLTFLRFVKYIQNVIHIYLLQIYMQTQIVFECHVRLSLTLIINRLCVKSFSNHVYAFENVGIHKKCIMLRYLLSSAHFSALYKPLKVSLIWMLHLSLLLRASIPSL